VEVGNGETDDLELLKKSKSSIWPYLVLVFVLLAGGGGYLFKKSQEIVPLRVLVAINSDGFWWQGSEVSAEISDKLAEELAGLGFETVNGGNPEIVDQIAKAGTPQEAAKILKAGFVVSGDLTPSVNQLPVKSKYTEARVNGSIQISFKGEAPIEAGSIVTWSGAGKEERALELLSKNLGDKVFQTTLSGLMGHKYIRTIMEGEDAIARGMLSKAQGFVELRDENIKHTEDEYTALGEKEFKSESGGHDIQHHSHFRSQESLCATGEKGFLIQRSTAKPFYDLDDKSLGYFRGMDELVWVQNDGKEEVVTSAYNLFSYGTGHPSGFPLVYIEDLYGWAKTITVTKKDGTSVRLRIDPEHRYSSPRVSIDGKLLAIRDRKCRKCPGGLLVLDIATNKEVFVLSAEAGSLYDFEFAGANSLFYTFRSAEPGADGERAPRELRQVDFTKSPATSATFHSFEPKERITGLSVGENGKWLVLLARSGSESKAVIFDAATGEKEEHAAGWRVSGMHASPSAKHIVYENRGEIYHFDLEAEKESRMTNNQRRDRYPYFSADGSRIYFEALGDDPNFKRRKVSAVASVKTP